MSPRLVPLLVLLACSSPATAIVNPDRPTHFFDAPWPDPARLDVELRPDLQGFPTPDNAITARVIGGWARRLERAALGFGNNTGAYFRFDEPLDLPAELPGEPGDPVVWIDVDTLELAPLDLRFITNPQGDPFYARNTLAVIPQLGRAPRSGATVAVAVLRSAGARAPDGYEPDPRVAQALTAAGVRGRVAVATVFTVQDVGGQLQVLRDDLATRAAQDEVPVFRRVVHLSIAQAETDRGQATTRVVARYDDGELGVTELAANDGAAPFEIDLLDPTYPALVYEGELRTWNYQGLQDRPYMRPGVGHLQDVERDDGWFDLRYDGLGRAPEPEPMRIVVAVPRQAERIELLAEAVVVYDHGTSGHAYNIIQRRNEVDDGRALLDAYMSRGVVVVGRDAPLYGVRFPLIDRGYAGGSLGFYNVVNLPAFRDNQRQAALDAHVVQRWVREGAVGLPDPVAGVLAAEPQILRQGHSLGSVTAALSLAGEPGRADLPRSPTMLTGTGGVFSHYFLDTGLIDNTIDDETIALIYGLFDAEVPERVTPASALGAALGLPESAWAHVDRQHPVLHLFQWTMDPSDPMAVAREIAAPVRVVIAPGDWQTPDFTAEALAERLPDAHVVWCQARGDYDPHSCLWREPEGASIVGGWLDEL